MATRHHDQPHASLAQALVARQAGDVFHCVVCSFGYEVVAEIRVSVGKTEVETRLSLVVLRIDSGSAPQQCLFRSSESASERASEH